MVFGFTFNQSSGLSHLQEVVVNQVFQGLLVQREKRVTQAHQVMALKDNQAPLDFLDLLAFLDHQALPVGSHRLN